MNGFHKPTVGVVIVVVVVLFVVYHIWSRKNRG